MILGRENTLLVGGFKYFLFSPLLVLGEDFQFDYYFSNGLKPPTRENMSTFYALVRFAAKDREGENIGFEVIALCKEFFDEKLIFFIVVIPVG